jgi:hypothetical protein
MKLPLLLSAGLSALLLVRASWAEQLPAQLSPGVPSIGAPSAPADTPPSVLPDPSAPLVPQEAPTPEAAVPALAKFEPAEGCYIGAFIERDYTVQGDISAWEELTKKRHASFFTYVGYGRPFPSEWVAKLKKAGASPHIAFEPNDGLAKVEDGPYLRAWARDAARAGCPIFLRWASEMNGPWTHYHDNPGQYIEKFRLVSRVMKEEAPNVAMVWTPFATPQRLIASYYPGDEWVDWVGVNIYAVYVNNGDPMRPAAQKDIIAELRWIYDRYADRKPIHISEFAATIYCKGTSEDTVGFAVARMNQFYGAIRTQFPRVKSVNWFCWNTIQAKRAANNYSFIEDGRALATYRRLVADPYFLSSVSADPSAWKAASAIPAGTTLGSNGITLPLAASADELLASSGALNVRASSQGRVLGDNGTPATANIAAANADGPGVPFVRGLTPGAAAQGEVNLSLELPPGLSAARVASVSWLIDGRTVWMTNAAPFSWALRPRRLAPGTHEVQVQVWPKDATEAISSSAVPFEVGD